jgi:hypothetical protein
MGIGDIEIQTNENWRLQKKQDSQRVLFFLSSFYFLFEVN